MSLSDPELVRQEYASEAGLRARASVYEGVAGPDARERALDAIREAAPERVLEIGCGFGEFAVRVREELGAEVVAVDLSERMVALARGRGVDAYVADIQALPFEDDAFDCVVANWMLYHVPDLELGLAQAARVLRPGGRFVAATNGIQHLHELWSLVGRDHRTEDRGFFAESGAEPLGRHFVRVERRDVESKVEFPDADAVRGYIASSIAHKHLASRVPPFEGRLVATRINAILVAEKAA